MESADGQMSLLPLLQLIATDSRVVDEDRNVPIPQMSTSRSLR